MHFCEISKEMHFLFTLEACPFGSRCIKFAFERCFSLGRTTRHYFDSILEYGERIQSIFMIVLEGWEGHLYFSEEKLSCAFISSE